MKNLIAKLGVLAFLGLVALLVAGSAPAQNNGMRMEIPVPFIAGNTILPAGSYVVRVDQNFRLLYLQGWDISARLPLATKSTKRPSVKLERGSLGFHKYGDAYVLRNVWNRDEADGWALARSQKEIELVKAYPVPEATMIAEGGN